MADKITKLSQAIRLGATFRPKIEGQLCDGVGSCAMGAAYEALTGERADCRTDYNRQKVRKWLRNLLGDKNYSIQCEIIDRNNGDGRPMETREQIADWLEAQGL